VFSFWVFVRSVGWLVGSLASGLIDCCFFALSSSVALSSKNFDVVRQRSGRSAVSAPRGFAPNVGVYYIFHFIGVL
jgi:hypothetical protein